MERSVSSLEWNRRSPLLPESLPCASASSDVLMTTASGATAAGVVPGPAAVSRALAAAAAVAKSVADCDACDVAVAMPAPGRGRIMAAELFGIRRAVAGPKATCRPSDQPSVHLVMHGVCRYVTMLHCRCQMCHRRIRQQGLSIM